MIDIVFELDELKKKLRTQELINKQLAQDLYFSNQKLIQCKQELSDLYDYNPITCFTIDENYIIHALNSQACLIFGVDKIQLLGQSFLNCITTECHDKLLKKMSHLKANGLKQIFDIEILPEKGLPKHIILEGILLKNNMIHLSLMDNTAIHELQNEHISLIKSWNLIHHLFQGSIDALASLDIELNINVMNEVFIELLSNMVPRKVEVGMNIKDLFLDAPELQHKILSACHKALIDQKADVLIENNPNGTDAYYCYELNLQSIFNFDIQKNEIIIRIKNLTDFKIEARIQHKQQSEIAQACRTNTMGEMASALAHEINQPLTAISAYSRSCFYIVNNDQVDPSLKNKLLGPLEKIAIQAEIAGEIIHNMKNFMGEGSFYVEPTDVNMLIKDTLSIFNYELLNYRLILY